MPALIGEDTTGSRVGAVQPTRAFFTTTLATDTATRVLVATRLLTVQTLIHRDRRNDAPLIDVGATVDGVEGEHCK
jgi:hypothetical protein